MHVLFTPTHSLNIKDCGILVPKFHLRAQQIVSALNDRFGSLAQSDWLIERAFAPLSFNGIQLGGHNPSYIAQCRAGGEAATRAVEVAYELREEDGSYNRYVPTEAVRPLTDLIDDERCVASASLAAMEHALTHKFCYYLGGGWHHAMTFGGRGFCIFNDIVVAIRSLQRVNKIKTVWVIDTDAHKGDGTAEMTLGDHSIATFSIHMGEGWPLDDAPVVEEAGAGSDTPIRLCKPWHWPSTLDVPVRQHDGKNYPDYLEKGLALFALLAPKTPDLAIVINGSDPYEHDGLPGSSSLALTKEMLFKRDTYVYEWLAARGVPQAWLMSGGYGTRVWEIHAQFLEWVLPRVVGM